jgi:hypothetical protein
MLITSYIVILPVWYTYIHIVTGFGLMIRFVRLLQLLTRSKDFVLTVPYTSKTTTGRNRSSQYVRVFINRCLVTATNDRHSPALVPELSPAAAHNDWTPAVILRSTVSRPVRHPFGTRNRLFFYFPPPSLFRQLRVCWCGCPLWLEGGSVVYSCCWASPVQSSSGPNPMGLVTIFYCLVWDSPHLEGQVPCIG